MSELTWTTETVFDSCGFLFIGDPDLIDEWTSQLDERLPRVWTTDDSRGAVLAQAECDGLPIEVAVVGDRVLGVKAEFTDDVADIEAADEGAWVDIGIFRLAGEALACDTKYPDDEQFSCQVELNAEAYLVHAFMCDDDCLGIRLIAESTV